MSAMNVHVVRPKMSRAEVIGRILGRFLGMLLIAWILMLIIEEVTDWDPSYWHTLLSLYAVRLIQVKDNSYFWTHKDKDSAI